MASRDTLNEAKELKKSIKVRFPGLKIIIDHQIGESAVFPGAIEAQGLTVSRWDGETPYVQWEKWHIREEAICRECETTWLTDAIGENNCICSGCMEAARIARDPRTDEQVRDDTAAEITRDLHREWWCQ